MQFFSLPNTWFNPYSCLIYFWTIWDEGIVYRDAPSLVKIGSDNKGAFSLIEISAVRGKRIAFQKAAFSIGSLGGTE